MNDGPISHYVHDAALQNLSFWVNTGIMLAEHSPLLSVDPPATMNPILPILNVIQLENMIGIDGIPYGIAIGGIRTLFVDVPDSVESGKGNNLNSNCPLAGSTTPFDASTIKALYPNHTSYIVKITNSTILAVVKRFITPDDGLEIIENAIESNVGN